MINAIDSDIHIKRTIPTLKGLSDVEIETRFEDFFSKVDIKRIEKLHGEPFASYRKELMKQSFIKNDGYYYPPDVWPDKYPKNLKDTSFFQSK